MAEPIPSPPHSCQPHSSPQVGVAASSTPILLDQLAAEACLDPWEVAEAIANTVNHAAGGRPDPIQLADGIATPHTPGGRAGKLILQRAWLDALTLPQLAEFRRACAAIERETLAGFFEQVLALFGSAGKTTARATGERD